MSSVPEGRSPVRALLRRVVPQKFRPALLRFEDRAKTLRHRDWAVRLFDPARDGPAIRRRLLRLHGSVEKGINWILEELASESISSGEQFLCACYKGPWALARAGRRSEARSLLDRITLEVSPQGDLPALPPHPRHYIYRHAFLAIGAHELGDRALFEALSRFVTSAQEPATGGFWSRPEDHAERWIDSASTAIGGLVQLRRGDYRSAARAADALARIFHSQPSRGKFFFTTTGPDGIPIADPSLPPYRAIRIAAPQQPWFYVSLPPVFLVELHKVAGERAHLELAVAYSDYLRSCKAADRLFVTDAGKTAAATAGLYQLTRDKSYAHLALSTSAFLAAKQLPNGRWSYARRGLRNVVVDLDLSFEYVLWLRWVIDAFDQRGEV